MIKASVTLRDLDGFDAQLEEVVAAIEANLEEAADTVFKSASTTAAFIDRTGDLRGSIKKKKSKFEDGGYIVQASGAGKDKGHHAANVEFGHVLIFMGHPTGKRVTPHPFMRPAQEEGLRKALELFRK